MGQNIRAKFLNSSYAGSELEKINFDRSYISHAVKKNTYKTIKIYNLRPQEASILKQTAIGLGFDACVNRGVLDCSVEYSDAILTGSEVQFEKLAKALSPQPFKMNQVAEGISSLFNSKVKPIEINGIKFDWKRPYIMGILNITPDSFSDGGKYNTVDTALKRYIQMIDEGADIIDIGAESTRPSHEKITPEEEIKRLSPILKELRNADKNIPISVDTRNVKTAETAIELGANIINDVGFYGLNCDMVDFVNTNSVPYVLMHNQKIEKSVVDEVFWWFEDSLAKITAPVIIDVGIGFGKTIDENYELISRMKEFKSFHLPLLVGHSRKSFLSRTFNLKDDELDEATLAISCGLITDKVDILRVHNVKKHKIVLDVLGKLAEK